MTALSTARRIREERWSYKQFPLAAVAVYQGGAAVIDTSTGSVTKGAASTTLKPIDTFAESVDNSGGSAGDKSVNVKLADEVVLYRFVNGSGAQVGIFADALAASVNTNAGGWRLGPAATEIERQALRLFNIPDIRLLFENDVRMLRQFTAVV